MVGLTMDPTSSIIHGVIAHGVFHHWYYAWCSCILVVPLIVLSVVLFVAYQPSPLMVHGNIRGSREDVMHIAGSVID